MFKKTTSFLEYTGDFNNHSMLQISLRDVGIISVVRNRFIADPDPFYETVKYLPTCFKSPLNENNLFGVIGTC